MNIKLGSKAVDKITGFEGIVTGFATYITGCDNYLIVPPAKDGDFKEGRWFDEMRLTVISDGVIVEIDKKEKGGDINPPTK